MNKTNSNEISFLFGLFMFSPLSTFYADAFQNFHKDIFVGGVPS